MKPMVITFVDDKMLPYAEEQAENVRQFGLEHRIFRLNNVESYSPELWLHMFDLTVDSVNEYGKIFRLDAEVRLHKSLPASWLENDNVFFQPYPYTKHPYCVMNTGQIILGKSGLEFCKIFKECMLAMIPPTSTVKDCDFYFDDEFPANFALRLSNVNFVQEYLKMDRLDPKQCSANRGNWIEDSTILTHPSIHNWDYNMTGLLFETNKVYPVFIVNHFAGDPDLAKFVTDLMLNRNDASIWKKISKPLSGGWYNVGGWNFNPITGQCSPEKAWPKFIREIAKLPSTIHNIN